MDSRPIYVMKSGNHNLQRRTYSSKCNENCFNRMELIDPAGWPIYAELPNATSGPTVRVKELSILPVLILFPEF